jgi:hypothetical protein
MLHLPLGFVVELDGERDQGLRKQGAQGQARRLGASAGAGFNFGLGLH